MCVFLCDHPYVPMHSDVSRKTQEANKSPLGRVPHLSPFQLLPCALLSKLEKLIIISFSLKITKSHRPIALKSHCQSAQSPTGCKSRCFIALNSTQCLVPSHRHGTEAGFFRWQPLFSFSGQRQRSKRVNTLPRTTGLETEEAEPKPRIPSW